MQKWLSFVECKCGAVMEFKGNLYDFGIDDVGPNLQRYKCGHCGNLVTIGWQLVKGED